MKIGASYIANDGTVVELRAIVPGVCYVVDEERIYSVDEWEKMGFTLCN